MAPVTARGTSISLFLVNGTPDGLWLIEKSLWTGVALMAPRSRYSELRDRPEMTRPGVYVLIGPADSVAKTSRVYVGETDVLRMRLDQHQKTKEFWTRVVVFTAKDSNLNKAHVRYLEARLLSIAAEAKRVELDNGAASTLPALSEADEADMEAFLDDMLLIYPVLGVNAFESADEASAAGAERLYLKRKDTKAEGHETSEGFVVYEGATARRVPVPSSHQSTNELREVLVREGVLVPEGEILRLTQDHVFGSPSAAAAVLLGRPANGRIEWKNAQGVALKALQERAIDGA